MKRILFAILGLFLLLAVLGGAGFGTFIWKFTPKIPQADYPEPANLTEARLQDLDYLRRYPEADKSYSEEQIVAFNALIDELEARAATMTEAEFVMEVSAAGAIPENGHSGVSIRRTMDKLNSLPVRFYWFGDGLHIVRAHAEQADLLGARVVGYGGQTPEALYPLMERYFGGNDAFLRQNSATFFAAPASFHAAGLIDGPDRVTLDLVGADGEAFSVELPVEDVPTPFAGAQRNPFYPLYEAEVESGHDWRVLDPAITGTTWFGRHPETPLWADQLDNGGVVWRMRNVWGDGTTNAASFLAEQAAILREDPASFLILDLRANEGGDYTQAMDVARNITDLVVPEGRVYVLTDGDTFSAGIVTAYYVLHGGGDQAVYAGAPMGDFMQFWAEGGGNAMRLPNSDIALFVSTGYHDWENGCSDWSRCFWVNIVAGVAVGPISVDLEAPLLFSDYARGVDTGIEAILAAEANRAAQIE